MTPRRVGEASAAPASSARPRRRTSAAVNAVRPQPARSVRLLPSGGVVASGGTDASSGIDAGGEQSDPDQAEDLQGPVADHDLLGGAAPAGVEEEGVAEDGHHERDDRQLE